MLSILLTVLVRSLLVMLFLPFSALDKILNPNEAVDQAAKAVGPRWAATLLIFFGFGIEVMMSLAILTGKADRLAAFILAAYCLVTATLWKQFWKSPDFRLRGASRGREIFWDFLKNVALAGGFLLLAFGSNAARVPDLWTHPFASTHPYSVSDYEH
jgi:putative oxidoreductase